MNKNLAGVTALMILGLAATVPMFAQYSGPMKVTVPFNFVIENERLQAGEYSVERVTSGWLRIRTGDGHVVASFHVVPTQGNANTEQGHFVFRQYSNEYFLARIWPPSQDVGWEVFRGRMETDLAKKDTVPVADGSPVRPLTCKSRRITVGRVSFLDLLSFLRDSSDPFGAVPPISSEDCGVWTHG